MIKDERPAPYDPGPGGAPDAFVERAFSDYARYVNDSMVRLWRFTGFNTLEWTARGATITDIHGQEYLDCGGYGVFVHGHNHPRVVRAVRDQLDRMALSGRTLPHAAPAELGRRLAGVTPGDLQYTFFCNSGAEAVEGSLKLARGFTGRPGFVATEGAFHGKTFGALSVSGRELFRKPFYPLLPEVTHVPYGDVEAMRQAVNETTAAVIVEPIQGENGVIVPPDGYLTALRRICDAAGALLILDEVQTGIGRTGKMFACQYEDAVPDIIAMAKALGGGVMPIGAFSAKPKIFSLFDENPYIHSSTFGGNPLACAAGIAALEVIEEEGLLEQAREKGRYLLEGLRQVQRQYPGVIREVRGRGLLIGLELATEGVTGMMISELMNHHVIIIHSLNNPKVIRVSPPAVITTAQLDAVLAAVGAGAGQAAAVIDELV